MPCLHETDRRGQGGGSPRRAYQRKRYLHVACGMFSVCLYVLNAIRVDVSAESLVCQSSLYRQEHLLTPLGKPACMPCFDKSIQAQPVQSPTELDAVTKRRSYARPHSTLGPAPKPVSTPSQAELAPRLPKEGSATIPETPRTGSKQIGSHGSVRKLAARFDSNIPPEEGHLRDMKQTVAELHRHLGKKCG